MVSASVDTFLNFSHQVESQRASICYADQKVAADDEEVSWPLRRNELEKVLVPSKVKRKCNLGKGPPRTRRGP